MSLFDIVEQFGATLGLILFFLGRDAAREDRMTKRIDELNSFIQVELITIVKNHANK